MPNDEGITPLHNAVCAGHHHIVKFLLDFGVNVNAADSDGWSVPPLCSEPRQSRLAPEGPIKAARWQRRSETREIIAFFFLKMSLDSAGLKEGISKSNEDPHSEVA